MFGQVHFSCKIWKCWSENSVFTMGKNERMIYLSVVHSRIVQLDAFIWISIFFLFWNVFFSYLPTFLKSFNKKSSSFWLLLLCVSSLALCQNLKRKGINVYHIGKIHQIYLSFSLDVYSIFPICEWVKNVHVWNGFFFFVWNHFCLAFLVQSQTSKKTHTHVHTERC